MSGIFGLIPTPWGVGLAVVATVGLLGGTYFAGYRAGGSGATRTIDRYIIQRQNVQAQIQQQEPIIVERVITRYRDRVRVVHQENTRNETLVQTLNPDRNVILSTGWVSAYNASANGSGITAAGVSDVTPSGISATDALVGIIHNNTIALENAEQLSALQQFIREHNTAVRAANEAARRNAR